ncbi:MAG: hypothetical protein OER88_10930 [Planctomycetota bacterium]|nr:hypothetical protein [Planctomycetota bacterium]
MAVKLTRCAWVAAFVLGTTALLYWPLRWAPVAAGLATVTWLFRRRLGIVGPLALLATLTGVVYAVYHEHWNPFRPYEVETPALTPNPTPSYMYDYPVISWLVNHAPYYHGVLLPILLCGVPMLLVAALVYAYRTSPR